MDSRAVQPSFLSYWSVIVAACVNWTSELSVRYLRLPPLAVAPVWVTVSASVSVAVVAAMASAT